MNRRNIITLSIILFLSAVLLIKNWNCSTVPDMEGWYDPADEIEVKGGGVSLLMVRKDNKWFINEQAYPGDADLIESMERKARDFKLLDLVSEKGYYDKYELTDDSGVSVVIKGNGRIYRKILIGKAGATNSHSYLKIDDRKEIYLASGIMKSDFTQQVSDLRDKRIFDLKKEDISTFSINYGGKNFEFRRTDDGTQTGSGTGSDIKEKKAGAVSGWICKGYENLRLDNSSVDSILALFSPLKASEFPADAVRSKAGSLLCRVTVPYAGKKIELEIYSKKDKDMHYAWSGESSYIFTLGSWQTEKLFIKNIADLTVK